MPAGRRNPHTVDLYAVLGVPLSATDEQVRHQYRELAKQLHPDLTGGETAEQFKQLQLAYETLSDPQLRRQYDQNRIASRASTATAGTRKVPSTPTGLRVVESIDGHITLAWDRAPGTIDGYKVYRGTSPSSLEPVGAVHGRATEYSESVPQAGLYHYCVSSYVIGGESPRSNPVAVTASERTIPRAPTALRATPVGSNSLRLTWAKPIGHVDGFAIYRWSGTEPIFLAKVGSDVDSYVDRDLEPGAFNYHVTAFNSLGESSPSDWVATGVEDAHPAPPLNFRVTRTTRDSATLEWDADPSQIDGFEIYRDKARDAVPVARLDGAARSYTESNLVSGRYAFYIAAVNLAGVSKRVGPVRAVVSRRPRKKSPPA